MERRSGYGINLTARLTKKIISAKFLRSKMLEKSKFKFSVCSFFVYFPDRWE